MMAFDLQCSGALAPKGTPVARPVRKAGSAASFDVTVGGVTSTIALDDGECQVIASDLSAGVRTATAVEIVPPNTTLDHVLIIQGVGRPDPATWPDQVDTTAQNGNAPVSGTYSIEHGAVFVYVNVVTPPGGGEGCTPGYWKQSQHFDSWPAAYTPSTLFSAVFEDAFPGNTLLDVLRNGGGGLDALGRHTVAALLNGASPGVSYDETAASVIAAFNAVFPGTKQDYNGLKGRFAGFNEQGCPLN